ncbi:DeoR family transcriptional regulator [Psychromonas sp. MB-3u-54]|uniref:DeoR/GlpR family DNA-binding transcription regulator n=1 Tax=Psychromonas sp. MB-3u-54 TaxID=2058319 RepID=UPI000C34B59F|nr:DeoR/GlpR family DNA-binding transcription regulator [Psychromonas sp. MB-3u-54]PKH02327.1 DeoR family transcriptional regulator [Psychromonas sp. MB-3u-54]
MIPAERQKKMLSLLKSQEVISISELVDLLDVSHMTIRRDIEKLESIGKVNSVSGGVQLAQAIHSELSHDMKISQFSHEKEKIGHLAANAITPNATIYLDAGTTALEIAHQIIQRNDLLIITNDFVIATYLMTHSSNDIYHTGGKVDGANQSTVGAKVADFLLNMNIDIAFISTSSWDMKGLSTPSEDKVVVKQAIAKSSKLVYLISDASKYGHIATFHALDIEKVDFIITDSLLPESVCSELKEKDIIVLKA